MSSVVISGDTSGTVTLAAPAVAGSNTITVQAATGTMSVNTLATSVASTSGTSIDFTGLPAWVKKITVMFSGVSTSGTSNYQIQIGSGSVTTTGYVAGSSLGTTFISSTSGFVFTASIAASSAANGSMILTLFGSNTWTAMGVVGITGSTGAQIGGGVSSAIGGTLDRVRITTVNGTDTFDAGSINILYEG